MANFFRVKNFEKFQHYKDRSPPWIKLYNKLLDDYEFSRLQDASKMHLIAIWLLASRSGNHLPYDPEWVAKRISANSPVDLEGLAKSGFIITDQGRGKMLASRKHDARLEREREKEVEKNSKQARKDARVPDSLFDGFWKAYPKRDGANPKQPALKIFTAAVKSGHDPSRIIAGAERYRAELRAKGNEGTPYVAQAMTWLRQARWDDEPAGNGHDTGPSIEMRQRTWTALLKSERETGLWQSQNVSKSDIPAAFIAEFEARVSRETEEAPQ